ncbi:hypothetical protein AZZ74_001776, partial [Klebsiella pneumoniae]
WRCCHHRRRWAAVSYTHLDVYKRQLSPRRLAGNSGLIPPPRRPRAGSSSAASLLSIN